MSAISGTVGAVLNADAQGNATEANARNVADTNAQNYRMWRESRGEGGSAVLPLYMQNFEQSLGRTLRDNFNTVATDNPYSSYKNSVEQFSGMQAGANQTANGIFNGGVRQEMLGNFQPVASARVNFTRQSAIDSLNKTLGEIGSAQAAKGFTDDSFGTRMMKLAANKQMSTDIAGANLQNLQDERGINDAALQLRLNNLSLPGQMAQQAVAMKSMPAQAYTQSLDTALQPLTFLRIGGAQPFENATYLRPPTAPAAALAMQGASGLGNAALNYWMQQQYARNLSPGGGGGGGYSPVAGYQGFNDPGAVDAMMNGGASYGSGAAASGALDAGAGFGADAAAFA